MSQTNVFKDVAEFQERMGQPVTQGLSNVLSNDDGRKLAALRFDLIDEEFEELQDAMDNLTIALGREAVDTTELRAEVLKEAADLMYVVAGFCATFFSPEVAQQAFDRVQTSNMSKLWSDGSPRYREDGKIIKPPQYKKPDLTDLVS